MFRDLAFDAMISSAVAIIFCFRLATAIPAPVLCPSSADCDCRLTSGQDIMARCQRADTPTGFPNFNTAGDDENLVTYSSLSLVRADLTAIPSRAFRQVPSRALDLTGNPLDRQFGVPDDAFEGVEMVLSVLMLTDCGLARIPTAVNRLPLLQTLQLDGNKIQTLKRSSFKKNSRLAHLFLRRNGLMRIDSGAFDGLSQLRELRLSDNQLTTVPPSTFSSLPRLIRLDLSDNFIHQLYPNTFAGLHRLVWLELESNSIHVVGKSTFAGLNSLQSLDLDRNPLRSIENGAFGELKRLRYLSLNIGGNVTIGQSAFRGLGSLVNLAFGEVGGRETLPEGLFAPLRSLSHLSISGRRIESTQHDAVAGSSDNGDQHSSVAVASEMTPLSPDDVGLRPDHFRPDMNFTQLYIWVDSIYQCRCTADWIRRLVDRGAAIHGSCGASHQLIQCARYQLHRSATDENAASSRLQQQEYSQSFIADYEWY